MSFLKSTGTAIVYIGLFVAVITFLPGLPPDAEFHEYSDIVKAHSLDPKVGPKERLRDVERLYVGDIIGPESFDSYNGQLYSGVFSGHVVRLEEDHVVPIVKFGETCSGIWQEHKCGRPLGLKFDKNGNLYVADAYYGIFKVNMAKKDYINIVNVSKPIDGKKPRIPNSLDIAENGDIYWSDSNTDFYLFDVMYTMLANPSGRLIRYNAAKKKNEVLLKNLGFANGVKLSDDESFVIVAEAGFSRIIKYHLKGPKTGQHEIFVEGLPGFPDNIHSDGHGGFLTCMVVAADSEHPQLSQSLIPHPYLRKMIVRLFTLMEAPFKLLQDIYPNTYAERLIHVIGSHKSMLFLDSIKKSIVLRIDSSGNIVEALTSNDNTVAYVSSAYIHNDYLWLGSPWLDRAMRVPLKQAFPDLADGKEQSSHAKSVKQSSKAAASNAKSERTKRDTDSKTENPAELKTSTKTESSSKPTPTTTPKPTTTSKASQASKSDKSTSTGNSAKPEVKSTPKPVNDDIKKSDTKPSAKSNSPKAKSETNDRTRENAAKTSAESEKKQDASTKQKAQKSESETLKSAETNRPKKDPNNK